MTPPMPRGYTETIPLGGWKTPLPEPDPAHRSSRPDTGIWPSTAAFMSACIFGGCLFVLWRAGAFR